MKRIGPSYYEIIARLKTAWGDKFVSPTVTSDQEHFFGQRVEVTSPDGYVRRGVIGITTGWQPSLLLLHRRSDHGSSDLLNSRDKVTAWIGYRGKRHPVAEPSLQSHHFRAMAAKAGIDY